MMLAQLDPSVEIAIITALQAVIITIITIFAGLQRRDTKRIVREHEPNHGDTMYDRLSRIEASIEHTNQSMDHMKETVFALNRRVRAGERLHSEQHGQNSRRLEHIEERLEQHE